METAEQRWEAFRDSVMTFEQFKDWECKQGRHNFVKCDEWEPTCSNCGKFKV